MTIYYAYSYSFQMEINVFMYVATEDDSRTWISAERFSLLVLLQRMKLKTVYYEYSYIHHQINMTDAR